MSDPAVTCHVCDRPIEGEPAGYGFLVFPHSDGAAAERPPLCTSCATALGVLASGGEDTEEDD